MDIRKYYVTQGEKPLDNMATDGGMCCIFRKIACVGDSLSSGEFESVAADGVTKGYHDMFEYSWGQFIGRMTGSQIYNFSRGGMTAIEYCTSFAEINDMWNPEKRAQAYIIALGVNDLVGAKMEAGDIGDVCLEDWRQNKPTFCGYYAQIIQRYKEIQPDAKFFLVTMPYEPDEPNNCPYAKIHNALMYALAEAFDNCYVIDLYKYAPAYDKEFYEHFAMGGHLNPMGYKLTADIFVSYIDYIIRAYPDDFAEAAYIGTPWVYKKNLK